MRGKVTRKYVVLFLAGLGAYVAFILNGQYFVDKYILPFEFGEPEMQKVLASLKRSDGWRFTKQDASYHLRFEFERQVGADVIRASLGSPLVSVASACARRTFRQSASACLDTTSVPLLISGKLERIENGKTEIVRSWEKAPGELAALGRTLRRIELRGRFGSDFIDVRSDDARSFYLYSLDIRDGEHVILDYNERPR